MGCATYILLDSPSHDCCHALRLNALPSQRYIELRYAVSIVRTPAGSEVGQYVDATRKAICRYICAWCFGYLFLLKALVHTSEP